MSPLVDTHREVATLAWGRFTRLIRGLAAFAGVLLASASAADTASAQSAGDLGATAKVGSRQVLQALKSLLGFADNQAWTG